jgi:hypothetical protein|nr:MAG TPA: Ellis van Creveld protein 2 like protein [Inoviridae sp.]
MQFLIGLICGCILTLVALIVYAKIKIKRKEKRK